VQIRRLTTTSVAAAAAVAAIAAGSPAAVAAPDHQTYGVTQSIRTERSGTYFYHWGDELVVSDYMADGLGARAYLTWGGNRVTVYTNRGKDTSDRRNLNLREGTAVWLQLCWTDDGENIRCSQAQKGIA
jgi:hypothetical protein